jgi:hypothetical protein
MVIGATAVAYLGYSQAHFGRAMIATAPGYDYGEPGNGYLRALAELPPGDGPPESY